MDLKLNSQAQRPVSATLAINERVRELWATGETVYHLGFGESRFPVPELLVEALHANAQRRAYLPVQGLPALREAAAAYYSQRLGQTFGPDQVLVGPGSKGLLFALQMALDADLIMPSPTWVSYAPQAELLGRQVIRFNASAEAGYQWTLDDLAAALRQVERPGRLLVLNTPNNPTGLLLSGAFLQELADFCRQEQIIVLSDEIYGLINHGRQPHESMARYYPEGTVVTTGLSKHLSLGGWRLGVALLPPDQPALLRAMTTVAGELWSTASAPIQYAAVTAYSGKPAIEQYIAECGAIHTERTQHIWSWLGELGIRCPQPDGAFYLMPDFNQYRAQLARRGVTTSAELASFLLEEYRIATLPGSAFGLPPAELSLRLSSSFIDMENDAAAATTLAAWRSSEPAETILTNHQPMTTQMLGQLETLMGDLKS
ncbi:MAG: aminotransferase class I/II-fold pyridoxal phosphate-dependent enzyme [Ardenticatenales bacterium]|nr:aminotransferase class I/II-fold pyridoxal phosphate-dependent enzyme [Ardenticatenales bacterium]